MRCSRRRARPAPTCSRAPCSIRRRSAELVPDFRSGRAARVAEVHEDRVYFLTGDIAGSRCPITPPPLRNHGNYVISLNKFAKWLAGLVEAEGVDLFTGFPGVEVLFEGDRVVGRANR